MDKFIFRYKKLKIISGGQTGVDQFALEIATSMGLSTGGWAPKGWITELGVNEELKKYGLTEWKTKGYPARTEANVKNSDITLIFAPSLGVGSKLTIKYCIKYNKPYIVNPLPNDIEPLLTDPKVKIINFAGTRSSKLSVDAITSIKQQITDCLDKVKMHGSVS
jgi:hypothetical protein